MRDCRRHLVICVILALVGPRAPMVSLHPFGQQWSLKG